MSYQTNYGVHCFILSKVGKTIFIYEMICRSEAVAEKSTSNHDEQNHPKHSNIEHHINELKVVKQANERSEMK